MVGDSTQGEKQDTGKKSGVEKMRVCVLSTEGGFLNRVTSGLSQSLTVMGTPNELASSPWRRQGCK